jgi:hypothetical protein
MIVPPGAFLFPVGSPVNPSRRAIHIYDAPINALVVEFPLDGIPFLGSLEFLEAMH